jgi:hypothetical protein
MTLVMPTVRYRARNKNREKKSFNLNKKHKYRKI